MNCPWYHSQILRGTSELQMLLDYLGEYSFADDGDRGGFRDWYSLKFTQLKPLRFLRNPGLSASDELCQPTLILLNPCVEMLYEAFLFVLNSIDIDKLLNLSNRDFCVNIIHPVRTTHDLNIFNFTRFLLRIILCWTSVLFTLTSAPISMIFIPKKQCYQLASSIQLRMSHESTQKRLLIFSSSNQKYMCILKKKLKANAGF